MTMATLHSSLSPNNPSPTQSLTIETNPLRDVSFSSYLNNNTTEESSFVLKLAGSSTTTAAQKPLRDHDHDHLIWATKKAKDREIGVFGAERYFNEDQMDNKYPHVVNKDTERVVKPMVLLRSVGTPSVRSESSMNSQSVLLKRNLVGGSKANKVHGKSFFSSIAGCKCVCSDKHSVDIDDGNKSDKAAAAAGNNCGSVYKMPLVQTSSFDMAEITKPLSQSWSMNDKVINHIRSNGNSSHGLTASVQIPSANNVNNVNNGDELSDDQSDTSSDLFEIESLTGKAANPNLSRQASEGLMSPTNGYAPSEASIEWSVVTASVADFSLDQFRSANFTRNDSKSFRSALNGNNNVMNKELNRRRSGNFMSCKSHKAVRVAGDEYRTRMPHKVPAQGQGASGNLSRGSHMLYI